MPETTGTITVTNGSTAVTGSGTLFADKFVGTNDALVVDGEIYIVKSVSSNTALTLLTPYTGTSGSGKSYVIVHLTGEDVINLLARKTTELVEKYGLIANSVTETPGAGGIPQADSTGKLADGWINFPEPPAPSDSTPLTAANDGSAGTSAQYARGDHVHPRRPELKVYVDGESDETILAATKEGDIIMRKVTAS